MGINAQTNPFPYTWTHLPGWAFERMLCLLDLPILPAVVSRWSAMGPLHCNAGILFLVRGDDRLAVGWGLRWRNNRVSKATGMNLEHKEMNVVRGRFKLMLTIVGVLILLVSGAAIIGTVYTGTNASVTTPIKPRLEPIPVSTPSLQDESSFWLKPPGPARVQVDGDNALDDPQERPLQQAGFNIQARQAAQRELNGN